MLFTSGWGCFSHWSDGRLCPAESGRTDSAALRRIARRMACLARLPLNAFAQNAPTAQAVVHVQMDGQPATALDRAALAATPRVTVTAAAHREPPSPWQGVALLDIVHKAGAPGGKHLRGHAMTAIVRISAADRYPVLFSLGELDAGMDNEQVVLADTQAAHPLAKDGPYRVIVPGDKRSARWIRNVTAIDIVNVGTSSH